MLSFSVTHEEEKVCLKEVYSAFYHQLVEAISDAQVCQSHSIQLRLSAVIPEEKIAQLISILFKLVAAHSRRIPGSGVTPETLTGPCESMSVVEL